MKLPTGPFLILGGNGLGKTSTLQATIYAIAGGTDRAIEDDKRRRWGAAYFKRRLTAGADAEVRVEFLLGTLKITVRRGFQNDRLRAVRFGDEDWVEESDQAEEAYQRTVVDTGNYGSFDEFRYVIHRLCYLGESRQSLVWEQWAQSRIVMLVCGNAREEAQFRANSEQLTRANTEMRHRFVDIGHLESRIAKLETVQLDSKQFQGKPSVDDEKLRQTRGIQARLVEAIGRRSGILSSIQTTRLELRRLNIESEGLQERLSAAEEAFVLKHLRSMESTREALALHKLLIHHRCPYCTRRTEPLAREAKQRMEAGRCPICAQQDVPIESPPEVSAIRAELGSVSTQREASERKLNESDDVLQTVLSEEQALRLELDQLTERLPRVPTDENVEFATTNLPSLRATLQRYRLEHARLEVRYAELQSSLDQLYSRFTKRCSRNLSTLQKFAGEYGEAFLGAQCEFVLVRAPGELHDFSYFVPKFDAQERLGPETCSESERFFLDIAFRMALIRLAGELSSTTSTFICETPENALDLAYTDNVAIMFHRFAAQSFSILLTANIQVGGVAKPLLGHYSPDQRKRRVFSLIDEALLTEVQQKKKAEFAKQLKDILTK